MISHGIFNFWEIIYDTFPYKPGLGNHFYVRVHCRLLSFIRSLSGSKQSLMSPGWLVLLGNDVRDGTASDNKGLGNCKSKGRIYIHTFLFCLLTNNQINLCASQILFN